jgi:hypothetical protein
MAWRHRTRVPSIQAVQTAADVDRQKPGEPEKSDEAEAKKPPTPPHTGVRALVSGVVGDLEHLPSPSNGYISLVGGAGAMAMHPMDRGVNARL